MKLKERDREPVEVAEAPKPTDRELVKKVVAGVMNQLGLPPGWSHTKAINTFENRWRVNVYATEAKGQNLVVRSKICDSFYVILNDDGSVRAANDQGVKDGAIINKYGGD